MPSTTLRKIPMLASGNIRCQGEMRIQCPHGCKGKNAVVVLVQADLDALKKPVMQEA